MKSDRCVKRSKGWSSAPICCRRWRLAFANFLRTCVNHFEPESRWKLMEWRQIIFPKGEEIGECAISRKNHGYILLGWERCYSCNSLPGKTIVKSHYYNGTIRGLNIWFDQVCHTQKHHKCFSTPDHTQVCTPLRLSQKVNGQCFCTYHTVLNICHQIFTCLILWRACFFFPPQVKGVCWQMCGLFLKITVL